MKAHMSRKSKDRPQAKAKLNNKSKPKSQAPAKCRHRMLTWRDYAPGHPYYYVLGGTPLPVDRIVPARDDKPIGGSGKPPTFEELDAEKARLDREIKRYEDLVARGADALTSYDKMYDEDRRRDDGEPVCLAIHSALAGACNAILYLKRRIAYLRKALEGQGRPLNLITGIDPPPRRKGRPRTQDKQFP
jgi:hypothetical protein